MTQPVVRIFYGHNLQLKFFRLIFALVLLKIPNDRKFPGFAGNKLIKKG